MLACAERAGAILIDDFTTNQTTALINTLGTSSSQVSGPGILGGERDMFVTLDLGIVMSMNAGGGALTHMQLFGSLGTGLIVWDGPDDDPGIDYTGLGGLDFTHSGAQDKVRIPLLFNNFSAPLVLTAYTDDVNFSTATLAFPGGVPPQTDLIVRFSDFVDAGASGGADIGAFSLFIDGSATLNFNQGFATITPEPSTATLLAFGILVIVTVRRSGWVA